MSPAISEAMVEAQADMLKTARELRENSNGNPQAIEQAIFWERRAAAISGVHK